MLEHGGRLRSAAARWNIALENWLDLSTGIAPDAYPLPPPPGSVWQRLPEDEDGLDQAARQYYGAANLLALPGSQAAIQWLPRLLPGRSAAVIAPGYGEYAAAAHAAGRQVRLFAAHELEAVCTTESLVVLGNPNNPDGTRFKCAELQAAAARLAGHGGWLVVDEAFADVEDDHCLASLAGQADYANVVVLRSLGKFFGLAGARVGFAMGAAAALEPLQAAIGPWAIAHPARWAASLALADTAWQAAQRQRLGAAALRLGQLLRDAQLAPEATISGTALFCHVPTDRASVIHAALAQQGILVRCFTDPAALRFGLPGPEPDWLRLADGLARLRRQCIL